MGRNSSRFDERQPRRGETIGGGFFVFARGRSTGRIRPTSVPFEYDSLAKAGEAARRLHSDRPGRSFDIFERVATVPAPEGPTVSILGVEVTLTAASAQYLVDHDVLRQVGDDQYELLDDVDLNTNGKVHKLMLALCHPRALERRP